MSGHSEKNYAFASDNTSELCPTALESLVKSNSGINSPTELGTVYRPGEIEELMEVCQRHGLRSHMDGARFAHAVAALGCYPGNIT